MTRPFVVEIDDYMDPFMPEDERAEIWDDGYSDCDTDTLHNTVTANPFGSWSQVLEEDAQDAWSIWEAGYAAAHADRINGTTTPNPYEEH